jgi:hypothetical protein
VISLSRLEGPFENAILVSTILKIMFLKLLLFKSYKRLIKYIKKYFFLSIECFDKISI